MTSVLAAGASTHPFTCNTCQVAFRANEAQRNHYHTDWHQYNLKRKVAELPPLSSETFAEKVLHAQASTRLERERATFEKNCAACNKTYYSENGYVNHLGSHKHRQNEKEAQAAEAALAEKVEALNVSGDSTPTPSEAPGKEELLQALTLEACLFCPYVSPSLTLNVSHMTKAHGLFIPEASYLVDLAGLMTYLGQKLVLGNQCLYCNKQKGGLEGIRTHMQDKGHTMLGFETEEQQIELGQFYDFRSTYSDAGEESSSSDDAAETSDKKDNGDDEWEDEDVAGGEAEGEAWETDSDTSDGWHSHAHSHIYHDEYELHLPSGRSVGHRSLARYYRQNLRDHPIAPTRRAVEYRRAADDEDDEEGGVEVGEDGERALNRRERREEARAVARRGDLGMTGATTSQKRDVAKFTKLAQAEEARGRRKFERIVNLKGNSQKHYRDPLLQ
ncbi:C2H2 type zinc-finger-domain-containing protein [Tricharina praecox]|uniref:C2H2 type zinc-finger-domain-containing protein n=1 Tax=Tricharina praecox TaxID=43433 RepID=UPI002220CD75|nr:C2H2 type zinc-finger-domain-containing protein [Tricharina praecox]KAI5849690.1 C2H2 type zinc-finger-domain-containing protein [Tricharina praecox]